MKTIDNHIAIVGRPNVGKSALFNRLLKKRIAIVDSQSGVTRDRIYGQTQWDNKFFTFIDTGGIDMVLSDKLKEQMLEQTTLSIEEAQLVLFVTDVYDGLTPLDKEVSDILRKKNKNTIVVVNKVDNNKLSDNISCFHELGWEAVVGISAEHSLGIDVLLEKISGSIPESKGVDQEKQNQLKIAIIGRPNAGKSTLINSILGENRMVVGDKPGTTRDAVDSVVMRGSVPWMFIDTGGMRKSKKYESSVEFFSLNRAFISIKRADISVLVIDGVEGVTMQDAKLLHYITEQGKACVIAVNKWDLVNDTTKQKYLKELYDRLSGHTYIPSVFVSSLYGKNITKLLQTVEYVYHQGQLTVSTGVLNKLLQKAVKLYRPPVLSGKFLRIHYGTQTSNFPVKFILFVNEKTRMKKDYLGYLTNQIRKAFGFEGIPLNVELRNRRRKH